MVRENRFRRMVLGFPLSELNLFFRFSISTNVYIPLKQCQPEFAFRRPRRSPENLIWLF
ncbi:protein of unknown function [Methylocaldum szegediense]|uniref:Uncharacterized protein n=1 Tax=Methylocaldum szegediense TaxID=73780 RepID=A0ABM9I4X0_9GAMM|nr:protein of unknown function [Methylocaldum szegediense]